MLMKRFLLSILFLIITSSLFAQLGASAKIAGSDSLATKPYTIQELKVYPNPVSEYFYFDYSATFLKNAKLQVYNSIGKIVITKDLEEKQGNEKVYVTDLENGLYFCSLVVDDNRVVTKKILVNR